MRGSLWLLSAALLCAPHALAKAAEPGGAADVQEQLPPPLTHYKGREIAQTMHYLGAPWLVRESREREEECTTLLKCLNVRPGQTVCDLGCGNGFYTLELAKLVGPQGRVLAVDIQPEMLTLLRERAKEARIDNVEPILGTLIDPRLPEGELDLVLLVDVYHELSHPEHVLRAVRRSLKPAGRVVLVEFRLEDPEVPIKLLHKMSKRQIMKELPPNGFRLVEEFDKLPWQHVMFFERDDAVEVGEPIDGSTSLKDAVEFELRDGTLRIDVGGGPFADYVFQDPQIPRPYFAQVHAPGGAQVTRHQPPVEGIDPTDHAMMHPGVWQAFGDLNGHDFWRNKAAIRHVRFVERPTVMYDRGEFTVLNRYEADGQAVCEETCRVTITPRTEGVLMALESEFRSDQPLVFGDQEEMGLGIRVGTQLTASNGGRIVNSDGLVGEEHAWGKTARWCHYSGQVDGQEVGILLMPHSENFRASWFHVRDYGLMAANPFGRRAFTGGEASQVFVEPEEPFRLRWGILVHGGEIDPAREYEEYSNFER
jgi:SAM-dependent methyltransferase